MPAAVGGGPSRYFVGGSLSSGRCLGGSRPSNEAGGSAPKLVTGIGPARLCYGAEVQGIADTHLRSLRTTSAAAAAPATAGKQVDAVLYALDASAGCRVDPAFASHILPVVTWATAAWDRWVRIDELAAAADWAQERVVQDGGICWSRAAGPAGGSPVRAPSQAGEATHRHGARLLRVRSCILKSVGGIL